MKTLSEMIQEEQRIKDGFNESKGEKRTRKNFIGGAVGTAVSLIATNPSYALEIIVAGAGTYVLYRILVYGLHSRYASRALKNLRREEGFEE